jgi:predicted NACHT family NTPase
MAGRVGRSLQLSLEGKEKAQKALTHKCLTQNELAKELKISRETVSKFFRGKLVDRKYFVEICEYLKLEWDEVAAKPASQVAQEKKQQDSALDIDVLVQEVRQKRHEKIQHQCATMRMLDISQPVALADIYTDVNILEQITSQQWREISELTRDFNPESDDFDTLGHGKRLQRLPGLDAVSRYSKLMLLEKPGAGKTTFLQWVAIKCDLGEFQLDRVPIFIRLRNFAEDTRRDDSEFKLLNYISQEFSDCGIADKWVIEMILTKGKALILLDGLDEVSEEDDEVVKQIRRLVNKYFKNQFIISCRIAAEKYRFSVENFTDVEVADFNNEQVEVFAKKWFVAVARNDREQGEATARRFIEKLILPDNKQIRELARTPILLNLTCFVFQTKGEFSQKRFKLYKQGLDILLRKWDEERDIQRDEVYRNLSFDDVFNKFISEPSFNLDILLARTLNSFYTFPQGYEPIYIVMHLDGAIQQLCHADIKLQEFPKEELLRDLRELFTQLPAELQKVLQQFKLQLQGQQETGSGLQVEAQRTNVDEDRAKFWTWWHTEGQNWATKLRTVMINYCNIGHEWQFSEKQRKALRDYYSGNRFLVECLNSSDVSHNVRQEIEETLLLPIAEIEQHQQQIL